MFDYEWATVQHNVNCRLAQAVVVPDVIPVERLARVWRRAASCAATRASRRSTTSTTSSPTRRCWPSSGWIASQPIAVVRTPPAVSLYHRFENDLFGQVLQRLRGAQTVVLPRTAEQREELAQAGGFLIPEHAIDAQSLIAYADLVVSAGGTMNREAVALGTPVFTVFEGRLGAVDERLIAEGRLRKLERADEVVLDKREDGQRGLQRIRRNPRLLVELLSSPAESR